MFLIVKIIAETIVVYTIVSCLSLVSGNAAASELKKRRRLLREIVKVSEGASFCSIGWQLCYDRYINHPLPLGNEFTSGCESLFDRAEGRGAFSFESRWRWKLGADEIVQKKTKKRIAGGCLHRGNLTRSSVYLRLSNPLATNVCIRYIMR